MKAVVQIRYFALLRDLSGKAEESLEIEQGDTAAEVYVRMAEHYRFPLRLTDIRLAVNDDFASGEHRLADGDSLVFIPPVAGG